MFIGSNLHKSLILVKKFQLLTKIYQNQFLFILVGLNIWFIIIDIMLFFAPSSSHFGMLFWLLFGNSVIFI